MRHPFISVIIPTYNCGDYIGDAIESVFRQNYANFEIIVVNDGSTDDTVERCEAFGQKVRVLSQENKGPASARNKGIRAATGSIIGLLDADDLWTDEHISSALPFLVGAEAYELVRGRTCVVSITNSNMADQRDGEYLLPLVGASLYKKSVFDTVGLFDEKMRLGEDVDWNLRFAECSCREKRIEQTTLVYRRREGSLSDSPEAQKRGQLQAVQKRLARTREARSPAQ